MTPSFNKTKSYKDIEGWFNFSWLYDIVLDAVPKGATLVEVGAYKGKSAGYMASRIRDLGLDTKFYTVDYWDKPEEERHGRVNDRPPTLAEFKANMEMIGASDHVTPLQMSSLDGAKEFEDKSVFFVFIDANHYYKNVLEDIKAWYPKLTDDGIIGGHDMSSGFPGVRQAVVEFFGSMKHIRKKERNSTWWTTKAEKENPQTEIRS